MGSAISFNSASADNNLETFSLAWLDVQVDSTEENEQTQQ